MIGRERDQANSEIARLISQSIQQDKERDDRRKKQDEERKKIQEYLDSCVQVKEADDSSIHDNEKEHDTTQEVHQLRDIFSEHLFNLQDNKTLFIDLVSLTKKFFFSGRAQGILSRGGRRRSNVSTG